MPKAKKKVIGSPSKWRPRHNVFNPNSSWLFVKGFCVWYLLILVVVHMALRAMPFAWLTNEWLWTSTCAVHSMATFYLFHLSKGTPAHAIDEDGQNRTQTQWEQIDDGEEFSNNRKFLQTTPVVLFFLAVHFTNHDHYHFFYNLVLLGFCSIPKMPELLNVRLFGLNKY